MTYVCGAVVLLGLNSVLYWKLFSFEYLGLMDPVEGSLLAVARLLANHLRPYQWISLWYCGIPATDSGSLLLPLLVSAISRFSHWSLPHSCHALLACFYCIAPATLYALCAYITRMPGCAFAAALISSLALPYVAGPHLAAVALLPVFLLLLHIAASQLRWWAIALTPLVVAAVIGMDLAAAAGLLGAAVAYLLAMRGRRWSVAVGVVAIGCLLACPLVPFSGLERARQNLPWSDPAFTAHKSFYAWAAIIVGLLLLDLLHRRMQTPPWLQFVSDYALVTGVAGAGHVVPHSRLLLAEFVLAACPLVAYFTAWAYRRSKPIFTYVSLACFSLVCVAQFVNARYHLQTQLTPVDIAATHEYRLSKWLEANLPGRRVFVTGLSASWIDAFADIPQMGGCCGRAVPNPRYRDVEWAILTGQNEGPKEAEISLAWLKAYGVDAAVVGPGFSNPHKFDGILPVLWRDQNEVVYDLQRHSPTLAHVVPQQRVIAYVPEGGLDVDVVKPFVDATEEPGRNHADFRWLNDHQAVVEADVRPGDRLSVQISDDPGWRARVDGKQVPIYPDGLGFMLIHPPAAGHFKIDLTWDGGLEAARAKAWQIGGLVALTLWVFAVAAGIRRPSIRLGSISPRFLRWLVGGGIAALFITILIRTAWVAEDAYIAFRVSENLFAGYGLRWNIADRVQTYTDPLYLALVTIAARFSGEFYLTCTIVSLILTIAAIVLITRSAKYKGLALALTALLFSKGFMDYSLSGLENPATHLAIAGYLFFYWRQRDPFLLSLLAALAVTNRQDTLLFFLPSLAMVYFRTGWKVWRPAVLGWSPFIAWSLFSVFYYGFLFPNTAYAKLNIGVTPQRLIHQGLLYFDNAWRWDTATTVAIALGLVVACFVKEWMLALGILLNLLYVVRVGGDYMTGRFLTAAVFMSAAILARYWTLPAAVTIAAVSLVIAAGLSIPAPTITSARADFGNPWPADPGLFVFDERAWNYPCSGLLRYGKHLPPWPGHLIRPNTVYSVSCTSPAIPNSPPLVWPDAFFARVGDGLSRAGTTTGIYSGVGMVGFFGGPHAHILDDMALGDALIARLPASLFVPGHYRRTVPLGYLETIKTGVNQIKDPGLHEYYDHLHTVISGDLWSKQRLNEILLINLGRYDHLLSGYSKAAKPPR